MIYPHFGIASQPRPSFDGRYIPTKKYYDVRIRQGNRLPDSYGINASVVRGEWYHKFHSWVPGQGRVDGLFRWDLYSCTYLVETRHQPFAQPAEMKVTPPFKVNKRSSRGEAGIPTQEAYYYTKWSNAICDPRTPTP